METFEIIPLIGAGKILFGSTREENLTLLGAPSDSISEKDYYQLNGQYFSLHYSEKNTLEFIEFSDSDNAVVEVFGINLFGTKADRLIDLIKKKSGFDFDKDEPEIPFSYVFPEIELALWRPVLPEESDDDDGEFFSTVGIGIKGYYSFP